MERKPLLGEPERTKVRKAAGSDAAEIPVPELAASQRGGGLAENASLTCDSLDKTLLRTLEGGHAHGARNRDSTASDPSNNSASAGAVTSPTGALPAANIISIATTTEGASSSRLLAMISGRRDSAVPSGPCRLADGALKDHSQPAAPEESEDVSSGGDADSASVRTAAGGEEDELWRQECAIEELDEMCCYTEGSTTASSVAVSETARRGRSGCGGPGTFAVTMQQKRLVAPLFTIGGLINTSTAGVSLQPLMRREWYHHLVSLSWPKIFLASLVIYLSATTLITSLYSLSCAICGAKFNFIVALYFNVVSLAANGGYMGEDEVFLDSSSTCYHLRTYTVMLASYLNIVIVAFIAALFVGKASQVAGLRHRIIFGDVLLVRVLEHPLSLLEEDRYKLMPHGQSMAIAVKLLALRSIESRRRRRRERRELRRREQGGDAPDIARDDLGVPYPELLGLDKIPDVLHCSYVLQFRVGNLNQAGGKSVLTGELHIFLVTQELANRHRRSVRVKSYELPWSSLDEVHEDDAENDLDGEGMPIFGSGGIGGASSKTLRLWFPATIAIALSAYSNNKACRLLHHLLLRHAGQQARVAYTHFDTNIDRIYDFELIVEYTAQDTGTGGAAFVARHAYSPINMLKGHRFVDTSVFLSRGACQRLPHGSSTEGYQSIEKGHTAPYIYKDGEAALEIDFRQFNAVELDD